MMTFCKRHNLFIFSHTFVYYHIDFCEIYGIIYKSIYF